MKTGYFQSAQYGSFHEEWVGSPYIDWVKYSAFVNRGTLRKPQSHLRASQWKNESPASFVPLPVASEMTGRALSEHVLTSSGSMSQRWRAECDLGWACDPGALPFPGCKWRWPALCYFPHGDKCSWEGKQNFLGLFITAIRSDRCSVAPSIQLLLGLLYFLMSLELSQTLFPWWIAWLPHTLVLGLPGVMILLLPGCDSVMECSSRVCVCVCYLLCVCSSLVWVFISFVYVHPLCVHALCVHFYVCVFIPCVCSHSCVGIYLCVFISCVCIHSLCVHPLVCVCSSSVCVSSPPICVFISYVCVIPFVYSSPVCVHTSHLAS